MYVDENHVTHIETKVIEYKETACQLCERPIQYHPDSPIPEYCHTCQAEVAEYGVI